MFCVEDYDKLIKTQFLMQSRVGNLTPVLRITSVIVSVRTRSFYTTGIDFVSNKRLKIINV